MERFRKMTPTHIRSEKYQFNWKPRYNSQSDIDLVKQLIQILQNQQVKKSVLMKEALDDLIVKYNKESD